MISDLPELTGSPGQVRWAINLRAERLESYEVQRQSISVQMSLSRITDATWWIANKDRAFKDIRWPKPVVSETEREGFSVEVAAINENGHYEVKVSFDGRSAGVLRMTRTELTALKNAVDARLVPDVPTRPPRPAPDAPRAVGPVQRRRAAPVPDYSDLDRIDPAPAAPLDDDIPY